MVEETERLLERVMQDLDRQKNKIQALQREQGQLCDKQTIIKSKTRQKISEKKKKLLALMSAMDQEEENSLKQSQQNKTLRNLKLDAYKSRKKKQDLATAIEQVEQQNCDDETAQELQAQLILRQVDTRSQILNSECSELLNHLSQIDATRCARYNVSVPAILPQHETLQNSAQGAISRLGITSSEDLRLRQSVLDVLHVRSSLNQFFCFITSPI